MIGLRWDGTKVSDFNWNSSIQPRLSYQYQLQTNTKVKVYYGQYRQYPAAVNQVLTNKSELTKKPADLNMELAQHYGAGIEHFLNETMRLKVEGFYTNNDY